MRIDAVHETVVVRVISRWRKTGENLRCVGESVPIGVGLFRIGAVNMDLLPVGESVAIGVAREVAEARDVPPAQFEA